MNSTADKRGYSLIQKTRAFLRGFRRLEPLVEVAKEGLSGRYALSEKQGAAYGERVARFHLDLERPNRAEIDYVVKNFPEFPPEVQKAALRYLVDNSQTLENLVLGAFCDSSSGLGPYRLWTRTRQSVRELIRANAHLIGERGEA